MPGLTIAAGSYEATFRPDCVMVCASLRYRGDEYVAWPRTISDLRAGKATAIPLVHPWANRLGRWGYRVGDRRVSLRGVALPVDSAGLPIHGNLFGAAFTVLRHTRDRIVAELDYGADRSRLRAFPFPHRVVIDARVSAAAGVRIVTAVVPTADVAVPVSFGWHPYLKLPGSVPRAAWNLRWPACDHVEVDARIIPTGARTPQRASNEPIASRTFDDHYALGRDRTFAISTAERSLTLRFDRTYPFAQLFVPPRRRLVAVEPMTAEIDALGRGTAPTVEPGGTFRAGFDLAIER